MADLLSRAEIRDLCARPENDCGRIAAERFGAKLRKSGRRLIGSCPLCPDLNKRPHDRFEIKDNGLAWVCRKCGGGDVIKLVELHEGLDFRGAVDWLGGPRAVDPEIEAKRQREAAEIQAKRDREADEYRQRERKTLYDVWNRALAPGGTPVEAYLRLRLDIGHDEPFDISGLRLRCVLDMPYFDGDEIGDDGRKHKRIIHRGPAMVGPIIGNDGKFRGAHFTWIDLSQPKGKALVGDKGRKTRGSMKGNHIDLCGPRTPRQLIEGEGIEKVLAVWHALRSCGVDLSHAAFWTSVNLRNIGGAAAEKIVHPAMKSPAGRAVRIAGPDPDLSQPGIALPPSVEEVTLLGDSTSDRITTYCALYRGAQRWIAANEKVLVRLAWGPEGMDFDDMLREAGEDSAREIRRPAQGSPHEPRV
jgi:hypothetical protein